MSSIDVFYRYKIPNIEIKLLGNKTWVTNLEKIANALDRNPLLILKWLSYQLNVSCFLDKNNKAILSGVHSKQNLFCAINDFSQKFVICPKCQNYETVIKVKIKKRQILLDCKACGDLSIINYRGKLVNFIIKNV